jgi:hypothetical protein
MSRIIPDGQLCARAANGAATAPSTTERLVSFGMAFPIALGLRQDTFSGPAMYMLAASG